MFLDNDISRVLPFHLEFPNISRMCRRPYTLLVLSNLSNPLVLGTGFPPLRGKSGAKAGRVISVTSWREVWRAARRIQSAYVRCRQMLQQSTVGTEEVCWRSHFCLSFVLCRWEDRNASKGSSGKLFTVSTPTPIIKLKRLPAITLDQPGAREDGY